MPAFEDQTSMSVHLLDYSHKHGHDITVRANIRSAQLTAFRIMVDWLHEFVEKEPSLEGELAKLLSARDFAKATSLWRRATEEEFHISLANVRFETSMPTLLPAKRPAEEEDET